MPKRQRTSGEGDDSEMETRSASGEAVVLPEPVEQSKEFWLEDGNIILQAGNVQFRVHRSILAKRSPIFADLFQIPQPDSEPTVDGCPVVILHDSAKDIEYMLLALYGDP